MEHPKRRAIAYIVGRIISKVKSGTVYYYKNTSYFNFSGEIDSYINIYDYSRSSYLSGNRSSIFDYKSGKYINLTIEGTNFSGYDYETGKYFLGTVITNSIRFYDYDGRTYYNFSI